MNDILLYAKYARGYRQGSINPGGSDGFDTHDPENVDSCERGAKTSFLGQFPSTLNVAVFYNDLKDQQIQLGNDKTSGVGITAIIDAGPPTTLELQLDHQARQHSEYLPLGGIHQRQRRVAELGKDLSQLLNPPMPAMADSLQTTWAENWASLGDNQNSVDTVLATVDDVRDETLILLRSLE